MPCGILEGGLFNCGATGSAFEIQSTGQSVVSIVAIFLWTEDAVIGATPYYLDGAYVDTNAVRNDVNKLLGSGSYWY